MENKNSGTDLTEGNVFKTLIMFALPILLGNIFQQLYGFVDSMVVGRTLGENSLAAVGSSFGISSIILAVAMGITTGFGIIISKMYGEGNKEKIQSTADTGLWVVVLSGVPITLFGIIKYDVFLKIFNVPIEIRDQAGSYLKITFIGILPVFIYNACSSFLRGTGDSKTPLLLLIIAALMNVVLDILFVVVFQWGVEGAAIATVASQFFAFFACLYYVNKYNSHFKIKLKNTYFNFDIFKTGMTIGIPATLQQLFISLGSSVLQILINGFGPISISGYTAASKIDGFATMPAVNIGRAMSNYVAQNEGANKPDRVKKGIQTACVLLAVVSIVISFSIYLFADKLILAFCDSGDVVKAGVEYLYTVSAFYIIFSFMHILNGILLGNGKPHISMISTIISFCLLQVPTAYFLSKSIGVTGIWIAAPVGWIGGFLMRLICYKKYSKKI
ncbi:MAG: MATE family efflux transporter [Treponema sp.]|jgi:putative MATE family efflux protein|nr:MATE family efflux transporter [Treponema sp.]